MSRRRVEVFCRDAYFHLDGDWDGLEIELLENGLPSFEWGTAGSDGSGSGGELIPVAAAGVE